MGTASKKLKEKRGVCLFRIRSRQAPNIRTIEITRYSLFQDGEIKGVFGVRNELLQIGFAYAADGINVSCVLGGRG